MGEKGSTKIDAQLASIWVNLLKENAMNQSKQQSYLNSILKKWKENRTKLALACKLEALQLMQWDICLHDFPPTVFFSPCISFIYTQVSSDLQKM